MARVDLICCVCESEFDIRLADYNHSVKRFGFTKNDFSCSRSCGTKRRNQKVKPKPPPPQFGNKHNYKGRWTQHLNKAKHRTKSRFDEGLDNLIDEEYLEKLWIEQDGKCALTGKEMTSEFGNSSPFNASVDRIDNTVAYVKGNVQFVCYSANLARSTFSVEEIKNFFQGAK